MNDLARFLERNSERFGPPQRRLYINPPARGMTVPAGSAAFTQDYSAWRDLDRCGVPAAFGTFPPPDPGGPSDIVLCAPREKALLGVWLRWAATAMPASGRLWLAGENRAGIKSAGRHVADCFERWHKRDSARHCALLEATRPLPVARFDEDRYFRQWTCATGTDEFPLCSFPGVFAHGRLDEGTALLLETLAPDMLSGDVLDFGCGAGVLAVALKRANPSLRVSAVDCQSLALASTRRSLALNRLEGHVYPSDGLTGVDGRFDLILSNPPFHEGVRAQPDMSTGLLRAVGNFLNPGGQLILVVNRHLPYRRWLDTRFGASEVLASNARYRVLRAVHPS